MISRSVRKQATKDSEKDKEISHINLFLNRESVL